MTTALITPQLVVGAGAGFRSVVRAAARIPLTVQTPCEEWDLGALVRHLIFYAPILAASGRRAEPTTGPTTEQGIVLDDHWPDRLETAMDEVVQAWGDSLAWSGMTSMAGSDPMPAPMIGGMVLGELVVHGWDLAIAARSRPDFPDHVLDGAFVAITEMAELGRGMGVFGPEVIVDGDASKLDRIVARSGRDPRW